MLRPEQMSKVSMTGSKQVMDDVIETVHDLRLLHLTDYDGSWTGFSAGDPIEGAETASDKLVTVRSLESILDVGEEDAGPTRIVTDQAIEEELEGLRHRVNELDDRHDEFRSELRDVEERLDAVEPFARLGIDLDLLSGYRTLDVAVGEGNPESVERALEASDDVREYRVDSNGDVVAAFARTREDADADALSDALVAADFAVIDVPDAEGSPEEYRKELEHRRQQLQSKLDNVEGNLREVKLDAAGFLLAAEEKLTIDVQKTEAPLSFATTENAFVAEGWVPTDREEEIEGALRDAVGDRVEFEVVEHASFGSDGQVQHREEAPAAPTRGGPKDEDSEENVRETDADADAEQDPRKAVTDGSGGNVVMRNDDPPVVQKNPSIVSPFEVLVKAVGRPSYREFDPTAVLFLTFPAFFGFMIGDLGYGALYTLIGYYLYANYDSQAFKSMGGVTIAAGLFTMLFGVLYGEIFGLHLVSTHLWEGVLGLHGPPLHKGLQPADIYWAQAWLVVSLLVALFHLNVAYVLGFFEELEFHGLKAALTEKGSWILGMNGIWLFVFSRTVTSYKPEFLFSVFDGTGTAPEASGEFAGAAFALGFNGFPPIVGWAGLGLFLLGAVLLFAGAPAEIIEIFDVLVNVLSYTRIAAVLLAKAGMAFAVNLLFFGAYQHDGEYHFMLGHGPEYYAAEYGQEAIMFPGLAHGGVAALLGGFVVLLVGHALVLALGITSAGLQAVRLEYYEFFSKFFDGGGREYAPFGYKRRYTTEG